MIHTSSFMADHYTNMSFGSSGISYGNDLSFEVSDFFEFQDLIEDIPAFSSFPAGYNVDGKNVATNEMVVNLNGMENSESSSSNFHQRTTNGERGGGRVKKASREKVAFRTKSEVEILDDGFKWRKYGKKMVKNSPNPRNYYKCSMECCPVKKRVERDNEDPCYVITTYEGIHNHQSPIN